MKKRIAAAVLTCVMLTGCGNAPENGSTGANSAVVSEPQIITDLKDYFKTNSKYTLKDIRVVDEGGSYTVVTAIGAECDIDDFLPYVKQIVKISNEASAKYGITFTCINPTMYTDEKKWIGWSSNTEQFYNQDRFLADNVTLDKLKGAIERYKESLGYTSSVSETSSATVSDTSSAPESVPSATSFFSNKENRKMYEECYKSYKYSDLQEYIKKYIAENKADKNDVAYTILDYIEPLIPYEENWDVYLDEFDNKYALTYGRVIEFDYETSFTLLLKGTNLDIKVGFARNDWLFFDKIELSLDGGKVYSRSVKSYDCTRNVIPPDSVEEYCACSFNDDVLDALGKADTAIIRFSNKKSGEIYDHTLTKEEKDALYCGKHLRDNNRELSNLIFNYREDNNIKDE